MGMRILSKLAHADEAERGKMGWLYRKHVLKEPGNVKFVPIRTTATGNGL